MADPINVLVAMGVKLIADIKALEWTGVREGPGNGPMGSGDGELYPACPFCGGLKEKNGSFVDSAVGHRLNCELAFLINAKRTKEIR